MAEALATLDFGPAERVVRVNGVGSDALGHDLAALPLDRVDAVLVPKVERPADVDAVVEALDRAGGTQVALILTLETPRGILGALAITDASPRTAALFFGPGDFTAATGGAMTPAGLAFPRAVVATAAAAVGAAAIDAPYLSDVKDGAASGKDAELARELGFSGKCVFHPAQVAPTNRAFTPTAEEVARARTIVAAYQEGLATGRGTAVVDGTFVAIDIVVMAERTLRIAAEAARRDGGAP
ncbi:HpcH/HpaI aldolase/citrate lyase family protein [Acuticoccus sp.]|uniref:HpcH/HpaI aldolase/citrate lyase family protein n=1 Tax=Acuticoccus sp. TaxID=1904378 RepID=UPI003B529ADA